MGNPKAPNQTQLQELRKSLIKGMTTIINISNRDILEAMSITRLFMTNAFISYSSISSGIIITAAGNPILGPVINVAPVPLLE